MAVEDEEELIEQSEMRPPETGLYCFINRDRVCSGDCMAYVSHPNARTTSASELSAQQTHCAIVAGVERAGRGLIMIASGVGGLLKKQSIKAADEARSSQFQQGNTSPFGKDKP